MHSALEQIVTSPNDIRQEIAYITKPLTADIEPQVFRNIKDFAPTDTPSSFMLHFATNKLAGTTWGEAEIWPDLKWLARYATWLEDRARLNRYRSAFMYVVQGTYKSEAEKRARQTYLNSNPPRPGQILVTDPSEQWGIMSASLDSFDASVDGEAIKKMIAVNHVPMHYLAEAESSTRTTADAAGTPTFKGFEDSQKFFKKILETILRTALQQRTKKDHDVKADAKISITAADASERDNAALALAISQMVNSLGELFDRELIDSAEYLRLVYRFGGETIPADHPIPKGIRKDLTKPAPANAGTGNIKTNPQTGDTTIKQPPA